MMPDGRQAGRSDEARTYWLEFQIRLKKTKGLPGRGKGWEQELGKEQARAFSLERARLLGEL